MIWQLVKRETAWREMHLYVLLVAVLSVLLPRNVAPIFAFAVGFTWLRSQPAERASLFQAGLPITAPELYLSRVVALFSLIWLSAAAGVAALLILGHGWAAAKIIGAGGALSVLVLAPLSSRVRELSGAWWTAPITMCTVVAMSWALTEYATLNLTLTICAAVCAALFIATWLRLPLSFEVVEAKPAYAPSRVPVAQGAAPPMASGWFPRHWIAVLRCAFPPMSFLFLPIIVMVSLGGNWSFASAQATFPILMAFQRITWLSGLPIRRGALFTLIVAPWLFVFAAILAVRGLAYPAQTPIKFDYLERNVSSVRPPLEFWKIAPGDGDPVIRSPWGETWRAPILRPGAIAIYNPYSVGPENSHQFMEWQYRRAMLAVYGQEVDFNDYRRAATLRPVEQQPGFIAANSLACVCWLLLVINAILFVMHWRVNAVIPRAHLLAGFVVIVPMMMPLALQLLLKLPGTSSGTVLMKAALLRALGMLPGGVIALLLAAVVAIGLLSWSALRLFNGMEPQRVDPTVRA